MPKCPNCNKELKVVKGKVKFGMQLAEDEEGVKDSDQDVCNKCGLIRYAHSDIVGCKFEILAIPAPEKEQRGTGK